MVSAVFNREVSLRFAWVVLQVFNLELTDTKSLRDCFNPAWVL